MNQTNISIRRSTTELFGDHTFSETWIIVTDNNGNEIQVIEDELVSDGEMPVSRDRHVKVFYFGQEYWIPIELHFPI